MKVKNSNNIYKSFRRIHGFEGEFRSYTTQEIFTTQTSKNQRVKILKLSDGVGLCLEINDDLMALEVNQDFLHRQMVKLGASNLNIKPRNIVILGGGDGGILKHCLKLKPRSVKLLELEEDMDDEYNFNNDDNEVESDDSDGGLEDESPSDDINSSDDSDPIE